jgi:hypothetical protein
LYKVLSVDYLEKFCNIKFIVVKMILFIKLRWGKLQMNLNELLESIGFDLKLKTKLLRHADKKYDVNKIYSEGMIEIYQGCQKKPIFKDCDYVISFIGTENKTAKFIGIYEIVKVNDIKYVKLSENFTYPEMFQEFKDGCFYDFKELHIADDLKEKLIINWGNATLAWHQWLVGKKEPKDVISYL